jgi:hypothetical protein
MSDVEATNPRGEVGDVLSRLKEKLNGQAEAERRPAPAPKPEKQQVAEPEPDDEPDADDYQDDNEPATAEHEPPEADEADDDDEAPETDTLAEIDLPGGKKAKIPAAIYEQIKPALLMQADYTRKTQEIAEIRKSAESESNAARQHREQYQQGLQLAEMAIRSSMPQPPADSLLDEDPYEYQRQSIRHQRALEQWQAVQAEQQRVSQHRTHEEQRAMAEALKQAHAKLPEVIPEWRDASRATAEKQAVGEYLRAQGYAPEEIATASDPRAVAISRKAMLYDRIMAKKAASKPVSTPTEKPGPSRKPATESAAARSRRKLAQTGRMDDGFAAFKAKLSRMR